MRAPPALDVTLKKWGAVPNSGVDAAPHIQAAIDYMSKTYGGGVVLCPPGGYYVAPPANPALPAITVPSGVKLKGCGRRCTALSSMWHADTNPVDFTLVQYVSDGRGNDFSGLEEISIYGSGSPTAEYTVLIIDRNIAAMFTRTLVSGGFFAVANSGVDSRFNDNIFVGAARGGGHLVTNGGCWYHQLKLDSAHETRYGLWQQWNGDPGGAVAENFFTQLDVSVNASEAAVMINDAGYNSNITHFKQAVFAGKVILAGSNWAGFVSCEFGGDVIVGSGDCNIVCSKGMGAGIKAIGAKGAANTRIDTGE